MKTKKPTTKPERKTVPMRPISITHCSITGPDMKEFAENERSIIKAVEAGFRVLEGIKNRQFRFCGISVTGNQEVDFD